MAWQNDSNNMMELDLGDNMMELDLGDDVDSAPAVVSQPQSAPVPDLDSDTPTASLQGNNVQTTPNGYWTASQEFFDMYEKHDLIFRIPTPKGEKLLGYNIGDNAYSVAAEFIAKHNLDDGSLSVDLTMRNSIANSIITKVATVDIEKVRAEKSRREKTFIPSESSTPKLSTQPQRQPSKQNSLTDAERKELKESEAKRKVEAEKARKALRQKKLADKKHREEIKERLRLDKLERMSARKSARNTMSSSSSPRKNPNMVPIMRGGEVTYVNKDAAQKASEDSGYKEEKEEPYEDKEDPVRKALRELLQDACPPKRDWTLQLMMTKFQLQGPDKLVEDMEVAGFSQAEITSKLSIIMMKLSMERKKAIEERRRTGGGGQIPAHLMPDTEAQETSPKFSAYAGSGQKLGSTSSEASVTSPKPVTSANVPVKELVVDETADTTTIRVSLHSGKRLRLKVNHSHTISDIQSHVESLAPPPPSKTTVLMNSFPRKPLTNLEMTVKEAGLLNSAIIQSLR